MGDRLGLTNPIRPGSVLGALVSVVFVVLLLVVALGPEVRETPPVQSPSARTPVVALSSAVDNFSAAVDRLVELLGLAGSGLLSLVWARVALSWFSNDISKKVQAKDRARDALIGTLLFVAAITGLFWGLAHWVLTGT